MAFYYPFQMKLLPENITRHIFFIALIALAIGLPLSKFAMSISQFLLAGAWLLSGNYKSKLLNFFSNKSALALFLLLLIHVFGLLYTTDIQAGIKDVKIKLPLLLMPLFFTGSGPLNRKQLKAILITFSVAVIISTLCSTSILIGLIKRNVTDIRDISIFVSHIRLSLMIDLSIFILIYLIGKRYYTAQAEALFYIISAIWLIAFLFIMSSITGIAILVMVSAILSIIYFLRKKKYVFTGLVILPFLFLLFFLAKFYQQQKSFLLQQNQAITHLPAFTKKGNPYIHELGNFELENGNRVYLYVSMKELEEGWKTRSHKLFFGLDAKGQHLPYTLIRYLTSKGLTKDAEGINTLSDTDIRAIEKGITNVNFLNPLNISVRFKQLISELNDMLINADPNGHSLAQRIEFGKTGFSIFLNNWISGVGTGDLQSAFNQEYEKQKSLLRPQWRLRAHNQYLTMFIAFGVFGGLYFLVMNIFLLFPKHNPNFIFLSFWLIVVLSMFTEDTLETQAGISFFTFFHSLFLAKSSENLV